MRLSQTAVLSACILVTVAVAAGMLALRGAVTSASSARDGSSGTPSAFAATPAAVDGRQLALSGFDQVEARGTWRVDIRQGAQWSVTVDADESLRDRLQVYVAEGRLVLTYDEDRSWWLRLIDRSGDGARASIVMPRLAAVELSGAGTLSLSGFEGDALRLIAAGASRIDGREGRYASLALVVSGAGEVELSGVIVDDANLNLTGANDVTLAMNGGTLSGSAAGAARIRYLGRLAQQNVSISGAGSVEPLPSRTPAPQD